LNNLLDMAAMEPEALSLMMGEPEGNVNTLRQVTGRKKRAKSITAQDYLNAMRSQSRKQMTHNEFKGSGMHPLDTLALSTMAIPGFGDVAGLAADARGYMSGDLKPTKLNMGMTAMGALPFIPGAMGGMVKAFHGTPHKVKKFKMDKIGTGEGAQAYGHGLYFAESEKVAKDYKKRLSHRGTLNVSSNDFDVKYGLEEGSAERMLEEFDFYLDKADGNVKQTVKDLEMAQANNYLWADEILQAIDDGVLDVPEGNLYNVNLDVNPEDLLDWDAPLPDNQKQSILNMIDDDLVTDDYDALRALQGKHRNPDYIPTGQDVYTDLQTYFDADRYGDNRKLISEALNNAKIKGIQYYDGMSRSAGKGTRNYVMFDEDLIDITNPSSLNDLVKPK